MKPKRPKKCEVRLDCIPAGGMYLWLMEVPFQQAIVLDFNKKKESW